MNYPSINPNLTMDETVDETVDISIDNPTMNDSPHPVAGNTKDDASVSTRSDTRDLEEPSNSGAGEPLLGGGEGGGEEGKSQNQQQHQGSMNKTKMMMSEMIPMRKSTLAILGLLLVVTLSLSAYFFTEWVMHSKKSNGVDVAPTVQDREPCVTQQQQEPDPPCPFTLDDMNGLQLEIDQLQDANEQLEDQLAAHTCEFTSGDIDNLQDEIDRLEAANNRLEDQLDDYEALNDRLNASIAELQHENQVLSENNDVYEELNGVLNNSIAELQEQNEFLSEQVDIYSGLNEELNITASRLEDQVNRLEEEVDDMTLQNDRLENLVETLSNETEHLSELGDTLQENVNRLEGEVDELRIENDRLETLIADLDTIVSFLNETAENLDDTYDAVTAFLAEQISTNRRLVLETLQNTYHQRVASWDCDFRDRFALEDFSKDGNIPISNDSYSEVLGYVEERVLSDLCLDTNDFEQFMIARYNGDDITTNRLVTSVQRYTWNAMDYYFPESGEDGLTQEDWAMADYNCDNLSFNLQYSL